MRDYEVLFLQIPSATRPSQAGSVFGNDIVKVGIDHIVCGYKHNGFPWVSLVLGENSCVLRISLDCSQTCRVTSEVEIQMYLCLQKM